MINEVIIRNPWGDNKVGDSNLPDVGQTLDGVNYQLYYMVGVLLCPMFSL